MNWGEESLFTRANAVSSTRLNRSVAAESVVSISDVSGRAKAVLIREMSSNSTNAVGRGSHAHGGLQHTGIIAALALSHGVGDKVHGSGREALIRAVQVRGSGGLKLGQSGEVSGHGFHVVSVISAAAGAGPL